MAWIRPRAAITLLIAASLCGSAFAAATLPTNAPGELKVAYRTDDKPVSFLQDGKPAGFLIELMSEIAHRLALKPVYVSTTFAAMVPAIQNHQYDTAAFGVLETPARDAVVDFTTPMGYGEAQLVSRRSAAIETVESAQGKTVAVTRGSALIALLQKIAPKVTVKEFPNIASSMNALIAGQIEGLFTGNATAGHLVEQHPELTASQTVESGANGIPVAKDRPELLAAMNKVLASIMVDGTFTRLFDKWNPAPTRIPKRLFADYPGMPAQASR